MTKQIGIGIVFVFLLYFIGEPAAGQANDTRDSLKKRLAKLPGELAKSKKTDVEQAEALFLAAFQRKPTEKEQEATSKHLARAKGREEALRDILWALVNTKEFMKIHKLKDATEVMDISDAVTKGP